MPHLLDKLALASDVTPDRLRGRGLSNGTSQHRCSDFSDMERQSDHLSRGWTTVRCRTEKLEPAHAGCHLRGIQRERDHVFRRNLG